MVSGQDPRSLGAKNEDLAAAAAAAKPEVARKGGAVPTSVALAGLGFLGLAAFLVMSDQRTSTQATLLTTPVRDVAAVEASEPLPLPVETPTAGPIYQIPAPQFTVANTAPPAPFAALPNPALVPPAVDPDQRRRAPALVVDLSPAGAGASPTIERPTAAVAGKPGESAAEAAADEAARKDLGAEEKFAERVTGGGAERVRATQMSNLDLTVPQGAVIPGVLETAINSDLPGFARAVVSRDVMGFDGTKVLIPRGSRLIGQYKSGLALGASRVFVIWTRVIRPDGVSVQIGSPGTDALGRGGLTGDVDRHFFTRFGGSILLSVLNAGLTALTTERAGSQIYIGSPADASNVAAVALKTDQNASPTVKTPQGAPIRIFVARDLDFSTVQQLAVR